MNNFNLNNFVRPHLLQLKPYRALRETADFESPLFLEANENPFGKFNRYPDSQQSELKQKLAAIKQVSEENLTIGNGSDELIDLLIRTFCTPGKDKIMLPVPSFSMYGFYAALNAVETIEIALNSDFELDKSQFQTIVQTETPKLLFLCSPNNPTGNSLKDLEFFISSFTGIVVVDEAYIEFSSKDSVIALLEKYPNLIVLQTLSKAFAMAGLRIGVAISSPEIASLLSTLKPPYNVSSLSQETALTLLSDMENFEENLKTIHAEREQMFKDLNALKVVEIVYPSDANFFLVKFADAEKVYRFLLSEQILTSNRAADVANCLRINVSSPAENERLFEALDQYQKTIQS